MVHTFFIIKIFQNLSNFFKNQNLKMDAKKAYPGMLLGSCVDYKPSENTYTYLGNIYAS